MIIRLLGDLLSPPTCAACDTRLFDGRHVFCRACSSSVERFSGGRACVAFGLFGGALAVAIRKLKYQNRPDLGRPLGSLLRRACRDSGRCADVVIPVPLHERRLVARGYNQAALLASHLAIEMAVPMMPHVLVRRLDTPSQAGLGRAERRTNLANAFAVAVRGRAKGRAIALVDDVTTTGATLNACSAVLLSAGARSVESFVVAVTPEWATDGPSRQLDDTTEKRRGTISPVAR